MLENSARTLVHKYHLSNQIIAPAYQSSDISKNIEFYGENNLVVFAGKILGSAIPHISIGQKPGAFKRSPSNCLVYIGEGVSFQRNINIFLAESNSFVYIGKHSMLSWNINIWATDSHSILDLESGKLTNKGKFVYIGERVWVGRDVNINKNSYIDDGCIIGNSSLVAKSFKETKNAAIAGNPAKIVKESIYWDPQPPDTYEITQKKLVNPSQMLLNISEKNVVAAKLLAIHKQTPDKDVSSCISNLLKLFNN